ncbi:MAG TPA: 2-oxo-tetronate isomerase [Castellaniella sp.]|nr:2-oxo-tetronate isomerase [Castellaniella sp.]
MPKFAANLSMLFTELDFLDRFAAAAGAGFQAVEFLFPYDYDKHELAARLQVHGLVQVLHNMPPGDWSAGERGIACHPDRIKDFQDGVEQAIDYARTLGCPQVHCLAGKVPPGVSQHQAHQTFIQNLRYAASLLADAGIGLLIEPINTYDIPGYFLSRTNQALAILDEVGAPNLKIQYDVYHAQRMEGELAGTLRRYLPHIGHIQVADSPGRHEPGTGEVHYPWLLRHIDQLGYQGWIGCEYKPAGRTEDGLGWLQAMNA